ncbi:MAG: rRNA synthase [Thermosediminibacterales bacterium]|nr:rRNA synthase [Thermosediminibacterales bacterium]
MKIRIQKFLSRAGVASRRKAEELIKHGQVKVNGKIIESMGVKIDPENDEIKVDNRIVKGNQKKIYIMLNKPKGYISSVSDPFNRPTVIDLIDIDNKDGLHPVGRLDYDSEGLLLLTNDGELTFKLTHPKYEINKTYIVEVKGIPPSQKMHMLSKGIKLEDGLITKPAKVKIKELKNNNAVLEFIIHEGKKRQIRRMCKAIGHPVIKLKRTKIGNLALKNLNTGKWRFLNEEEIQYLKNI